jgi:glucosamine-phosphate N-acetyltransferase
MNNTQNYEDLMREYSDSEYLFRYLEEDDYNKGYFDLLSQLTVAPTPTYEAWLERFNEIKNSHLCRTFVIEYLPDKKVIGTITCCVELKFIRNLGKISHIEDVVVDSKHQQKKFGSKMINIAKEYSKQIGCYKILLDARDKVISFYEKMGFSNHSNGMAIYL